MGTAIDERRKCVEQVRRPLPAHQLAAVEDHERLLRNSETLANQFPRSRGCALRKIGIVRYKWRQHEPLTRYSQPFQEAQARCGRNQDDVRQSSVDEANDRRLDPALPPPPAARM